MKVLTTGYWPTPQQVTACQLPPLAQQAFDDFKMFYLNRHTGRQLSLQGNMGKADLTAIFYGKKREENQPETVEGANQQPEGPPKERKHILSVRHPSIYIPIGYYYLFSALLIICVF